MAALDLFMLFKVFDGFQLLKRTQEKRSSVKWIMISSAGAAGLSECHCKADTGGNDVMYRALTRASLLALK